MNLDLGMCVDHHTATTFTLDSMFLVVFSVEACNLNYAYGHVQFGYSRKLLYVHTCCQIYLCSHGLWKEATLAQINKKKSKQWTMWLPGKTVGFLDPVCTNKLSSHSKFSTEQCFALSTSGLWFPPLGVHLELPESFECLAP